MNTSMKIYLVIHKFCNEDYDGNPRCSRRVPPRKSNLYIDTTSRGRCALCVSITYFRA